MTGDTDLVTVGIPFYNAEKTLSAAIESVLHQTYTNLEVILINDGSRDSSLAIAESFIKDKRVKLFSDGLNQGLAKRLNQITVNASGIYIARMDADDVMDKKRIEIQINYLNAHKNIDLLGSSAIIINEKSNIIGKLKMPSYPNSSDEIFFLNSFFIHPTVIGKKSFFQKNQYNDTFRDFSEDRELWLRTYKTSNFYNLSDNFLLFYRQPKKINIKTYIRRNMNLIKVFKMYSCNLPSKNSLLKLTLIVYIKITITWVLSLLHLTILLNKIKYNNQTIK